ncbi:MAG: RNA polymerase sigma factor [Acidimicrobiia bacterium]
MATDDDIPAELARRAPAAPDGSFDAFFRAHYAALVRSMTVVCGRRDTAEDCVQEAFARAHARWRRIGRYDDPVAWVRRVAINRARDEHRRTQRGDRLTERLASDPVATRAAGSVTDGHGGGDGRLEHLISLLTPRQRAVVALFYVERASIAQIADSVGISEGAVKFHLNQARARLRTGLTDHGGGPA